MKSNNQHDFQYMMVLSRVLNTGVDLSNRTGTDTRACFGGAMRFDLPVGFPALTTKKLAWKAVVGELLGFMRGYTSAAQFRALGCKIWDADANENVAWLNNPLRKGHDDLGRIYGTQWRDWSGGTSIESVDLSEIKEGETWFPQPMGSFKATKRTVIRRKKVDQFRLLIDGLRDKPHNRRHIVTAWNPAEISDAALPPCHLFFQCDVLPSGNFNYLHLSFYMRSWDLFLGAPFNIASYSLLNHIISGLTHLTAGTTHAMYGNHHIYHNSIEQVKVLLKRETFAPPHLKINWPSGNLDERWDWIMNTATTDDFQLINYQCHPPITVEMCTERAAPAPTPTVQVASPIEEPGCE